MTSSVNIIDLLDYAMNAQASDTILSAGHTPRFRIDGQLRPSETNEFPTLSNNEVQHIIEGLMTEEQARELHHRAEFDFARENSRYGRVRVHVARTGGRLMATLRIIPRDIKDVKALGLPERVKDLLKNERGLLLITGPTDAGKTTTIASLIQHINATQYHHILTIEDPIEFTYESSKSLIHQQEIPRDAADFKTAVRASLRMTPNVIVVGEMRDYETIRAVLSAAETGHLVIATLHTRSAAEAASRIVDVFPSDQQEQARVQLAQTLIGVVHQQLIPKITGGRALAYEILTANDAVRKAIRENLGHTIANIMRTANMPMFDKSLAFLTQTQAIREDVAMRYTHDAQEYRRYLTAR